MQLQSHNIPVKDQPLARDPHSKAILSTDRQGLEAYKKERARVQSEQERINNIENKLLNQEKSLENISSMLHKLLEKED